MYKEEKIFNGILCYKSAKDGQWRPYTLEQLTKRLQQYEEFTAVGAIL